MGGGNRFYSDPRHENLEWDKNTPKPIPKTFTEQDIELAFAAGAEFARDMFNQPSCSEYIDSVK